MLCIIILSVSTMCAHVLVCLRWKAELVLLMLGEDCAECLAAISTRSPHADVSSPSSFTEAFHREDALQHPVLL